MTVAGKTACCCPAKQPNNAFLHISQRGCWCSSFTHNKILISQCLPALSLKSVMPCLHSLARSFSIFTVQPRTSTNLAKSCWECKTLVLPSETPGTETWSRCPAAKDRHINTMQTDISMSPVRWLTANLSILIVNIFIESSNNRSVDEQRTHHNNGL